MNDVVTSSAAVGIRPARPDDLDRVRELLAAADLPVDGLADQFGEGYVVAEVDGRVVGAAGIERYGASGLLRSAVVAPEQRGRGVGLALTRDRLEWARAQGLDAVFLLTTTAPEYFARFGFRQIDRERAPAGIAASPEFASICPSTAVAMTLSLAEGSGRGG